MPSRAAGPTEAFFHVDLGLLCELVGADVVEEAVRRTWERYGDSPGNGFHVGMELQPHVVARLRELLAMQEARAQMSSDEHTHEFVLVAIRNDGTRIYGCLGCDKTKRECVGIDETAKKA